MNGIRVLDLCCGKGGDISKLANADISIYVGADLAANSVETAEERGRQLFAQRRQHVSQTYLATDCFRTRIAAILADRVGAADAGHSPIYDLVSCQFSLHYAFEAEDALRGALLNVSERLRIGGLVVFTTINETTLLSRLASHQQCGNSIYRVRALPTFNSGNGSVFGRGYHFTLRDTIDCPEFLVDTPTLLGIAHEYGLTVRRQFESLLDVARTSEGSREDTKLRQRYQQHGGLALSEDEAEVISLYQAIILVKTHEPAPLPLPAWLRPE